MTRRTDHLDRVLNRESLSILSRVQPKDPETRYAEARSYLAERKKKAEAPAVEGSYCGNVGAAHRAGGW